MKNSLLSFISERCPDVYIRSVNSFTVKDTDDEDGFIGEHFIVNCSIGVPSDTSGKLLKTIEKTCLVSINEYQRWKSKDESVQWL